MTWLFFTILAPFLWSVNIVADQFLVRRFFNDSPVVYLVFGALLYIPVALGFMAFFPQMWDVPFWPALMMMATGAIYMIGLIPYTYAIQKTESSITTVMYQLSPVFVFIFAWLLFGEVVEYGYLIGGGIILLAAIGISIDFKKGRFRKSTLAYVTLSSVILAGLTLLNRHLSAHYSEINIWAWYLCGTALTGVVMFCLSSHWRKIMIRDLPVLRGKALALIVMQEVLDALAILLLIYALAAAPSAGVVAALCESFQCVFVFLMGWVASTLLPLYFDKRTLGWRFVFRAACVLMVCVGLWIINMADPALAQL